VPDLLSKARKEGTGSRLAKGGVDEIMAAGSYWELRSLVFWEEGGAEEHVRL